MTEFEPTLFITRERFTLPLAMPDEMMVMEILHHPEGIATIPADSSLAKLMHMYTGLMLNLSYEPYSDGSGGAVHLVGPDREVLELQTMDTEIVLSPPSTDGLLVRRGVPRLVVLGLAPAPDATEYEVRGGFMSKSTLTDVDPTEVDVTRLVLGFVPRRLREEAQRETSA